MSQDFRSPLLLQEQKRTHWSHKLENTRYYIFVSNCDILIKEHAFFYEVLKMLALCSSDIKTYDQRRPQESHYYKCVANNYERLQNVWSEKYQKDFGYFRNYTLKVIHKYLDCGDLHKGFARVKCCECHHEYLVPFSCKCRQFCPSCHQKRVVEFGEYLR